MHLSTAGVNTGKAYTWKAAHIFQDDVSFEQGVADSIIAGIGSGGQVSLGVNLDADGVLIKRDVDGGSSYSEAGANLVLQRDVTNVTAEGGNFLENQTAAGVILSRFDASGHLILGEVARLKNDGAWFQVRNLADDGYVSARFDSFVAEGYCRGENMYADSYRDREAIGAACALGGRARTTDAVPGAVSVRGNAALPAATTNKVGGAIDIYGGAGDGAGGQTAAHGGQVSLHGGIAASDLASSNGGNVLLYGGQHGSSGNEGSVKIVNADGTTPIAAFTESKIGFFGIAAAPVAQLAKASYNNWAALGDVVNALVAIGLFDAA